MKSNIFWKIFAILVVLLAIGGATLTWYLFQENRKAEFKKSCTQASSDGDGYFDSSAFSKCMDVLSK